MNRLSFTGEEKAIILFTGLSHYLVHAFMLIFPAVLLSISEEFGVGFFTLGIAGNIAYFAFGLGALPAGYLCDKLGPVKLLLLFLTGAAAFSFLVSFSVNFWIFTIFLTGLGMLGSIYHPAGLTFISKTVRNRSRALGYHGIGGSLGLASAPVISGFLASRYSWRAPFLIFSLISLPIIALLHFSKVKSGTYFTEEERKSRIRTDRRSILLFYMIAVLIGFAYRGTFTFLPLHFAENIKVSWLTVGDLTRGGLITSVVLVAGMFGQLTGGKFGEKYRLEPFLVVLLILNIPFLISMGIFKDEILILTSIIFAFTHFIWQPVGNSLIAKYTSFRRRGLGYGISNFLTFGVGSFSSGISGYIAESAGVNYVFIFLGSILSISILIALILWKVSTYERAVPSPGPMPFS
ncbi:MAG: MFS transporter [Fidelibacterota bacterium]